MKKVLYFGKMDLPFNNASACRVMAVASCLKLSGFDVFPFGYTKGNVFNGTVDGISYTNDVYPRKFFEYIRTFGRKNTIRNRLESFDPAEIVAVFVTTVGHIQLKYLGKWCRKNKIPLIFDCGDIIRYSNRNPLFGLVSSIEFHLYHKAVKKYASVMAISSYIYDMFKGKCLHTFVVPCITYNKSVRFSVSANEKVDKTKLNIGYFGVPGKNFRKDRLDWCLDSFKEIENKDSVLYLAGLDKKDLPEKYRSVPNVVYLGKISNSDCISYIKHMDFVVFFRENNEIAKAGFPSKVSEAFACNTPVLTNETSDLKAYLNENNSVEVKGYRKEDCNLMFKKIVALEKSDINNMKKHIAVDNALSIERWKDYLLENINLIQSKINS